MSDKTDKTIPLLLPEVIDEDATGKNLASLKKSRFIRGGFKERYGQVPTSILKSDKARQSGSVDDKPRDEGRRYSDTNAPRETSESKQLYEQAFYFSGRGARKGALSTFPQNIGRIMVDFYCPERGVVYDPFAGHNSRMELVWKCKRDYVGVDICVEFMEHNEEIKKKLYAGNEMALALKNPAKIDLILGSSCKVDLPDRSADFTVTSPPYWDIEYYGPEEEQLGLAKSYDSFINSLKPHIEENARILKPGSYCAWFVNDFIKDKIFYPVHADLISYFREANFKLKNIYVVDLGNPLTAAYVQQIKKTNIFPKRHEYCLLFKRMGTISKISSSESSTSSKFKRRS